MIRDYLNLIEVLKALESLSGTPEEVRRLALDCRNVLPPMEIAPPAIRGTLQIIHTRIEALLANPVDSTGKASKAPRKR